jgi:hypothetical protein
MKSADFSREKTLGRNQISRIFFSRRGTPIDDETYHCRSVGEQVPGSLHRRFDDTVQESTLVCQFRETLLGKILKPPSAVESHEFKPLNAPRYSDKNIH